MVERLRAILMENKDKYIEPLKKVVSCDTQVIGHGIKGGKEKNGQLYVEELLTNMGAEVKRDYLTEETIQRGLKEYNEGNPGHVLDERYNVIGEFKGKGSKSLMFNGHIDTMPVGDLSLWETDPFNAVIKDGRIYGLGTSDMKAGLMASVMAVKLLKDAGVELPCDVKILSVVDEEGGGNGSLNAVLNGYSADAAVVCEPSDNEMVTANMGFVFFQVEVTGVSLHSGYKWLGVNAIEKAIYLIQALQELERNWLMNYKHPLLPSPTLNIGVIEGGTAGSTVPNYCSFKLCLHYIPNMMNHNQVVKDVTDAIMLRANGDEWLKDNPPKITLYQAGGGFEMDRDHPFIKTVYDSAREVMGDRAKMVVSASGNDSRLFQSIAKMPVLTMGPGNKGYGHKPNESASIDYYLEAILTYAQLILNWAKA